MQHFLYTRFSFVYDFSHDSRSLSCMTSFVIVFLFRSGASRLSFSVCSGPLKFDSIDLPRCVLSSCSMDLWTE
ncbi:hypothetical protein BJY00DRAFT_273162 [Aspergillus carlsbadensis]|nr:hypothetical protein BJY00DRAFT_273162 [Aspergillus carlsbadensis]